MTALSTDPAHTLLAQRAAHFRQQILDVATGPGGMIMAFTHFDTRKPFQEGEEQHWYLARNLEGVWGGFTPRPTVAEWYYGENTLWATGWFLWSQILRYRATQEPEALATARKCFRDLNNLFRLCRELEPGLLGKPHGGRAGPTTSYDQAASPVLFYAIYAQELATPAEKAEAVANLAVHGDYYLRRNWVMNMHGNLRRIVDPSSTSTMKYLACVYAAYELTGETRFRDAALRYMRQLMDSGKLPWPTNPYELGHNQYYWALLCDYWQRTELAAAADWVGYIKEYWQAAQMAIDAEGLTVKGPYDWVHRTFTPHPHRWVGQADLGHFPTLDPSRIERRWVSATAYANRMFDSACFAALGLLARQQGLDEQAHAAAQRTLVRMDESTLRWWWDDGNLPADLKPLFNIFAPEVAALWLVAYWMGRLQKVW